MKAEMTKSEFRKKFKKKMGVTSLQYIQDGRFVEVFKTAKIKNRKKHKSLWGYELAGGELTKSMVRERIRYMKEKIKDGVWADRALRFAKHHLASLERKVKEVS